MILTRLIPLLLPLSVCLGSGDVVPGEVSVAGAAPARRDWRKVRNWVYQLTGYPGLAAVGFSPAALVAQPDLSGLEFLRQSDDYRVWIDGHEQFVYKSLKTGNHGSHDITSMSFLGFDLVKPVEIRVEPKVKVISFAVRPYNAKIAASLAGNALSFKIHQPQHLVVQVNDSYNPVLVISARLPHTPPQPAAVKYFFGPGVHDIGKHLLLASGDKVYLAAGAIVKGGFALSNVSDVSITGRGIIYNGHYPHEEAFQVIKGDGTKDVLIEGVTICNSPGWIVSFWNGNTNLTVRDVTMVGNWWMNTDGVQTGTENLRVENSFMQCNDDNFSLNGICKNVVIRDNVLWNIFNGGVFMFGWATGQQFELGDLDIIDNVILRAGGCCDYDRKAPISMKLFGRARTARNIRIKNLDIEDIAPYGRWLDLQAGKANRSTLGDFAIENVKIRKTWKVEGEIAGNADGCLFENVSFKNVEIAGKLMETPADGGLNLINTKGATIQGRAFNDVICSAADHKPEAPLESRQESRGAATVPRLGLNLLKNPAFKDGLANWTASDPKAIQLIALSESKNGEKVLRLSKGNGGVSIEQDVTELLREHGPGQYTWSVSVRGVDVQLPVKATIVIEDEAGTQQHPTPDVVVTVDSWIRTERRTPLSWVNLKHAALRIESNWREKADFFVNECWLSKL